MNLPAELRGQVYREFLDGGGRTIVVICARSCRIEGLRVDGKDIYPLYYVRIDGPTTKLFQYCTNHMPSILVSTCITLLHSSNDFP